MHYVGTGMRVVDGDTRHIHEDGQTNKEWIYEPNPNANPYLDPNMLLLQESTRSEHTDVIADALLLVLRNALGYPGDVSDLL